jgi:hypothetical protein
VVQHELQCGLLAHARAGGAPAVRSAGRRVSDSQGAGRAPRGAAATESRYGGRWAGSAGGSGGWPCLPEGARGYLPRSPAPRQSVPVRPHSGGRVRTRSRFQALQRHRLAPAHEQRSSTTFAATIVRQRASTLTWREPQSRYAVAALAACWRRASIVQAAALAHPQPAACTALCAGRMNETIFICYYTHTKSLFCIYRSHGS